ncbi:MAG: hypothetical protein JWM10_2077 [Myxococcaceae bacterium]|nr:hypothetical protein [Myxococcaceae bacterium]
MTTLRRLPLILALSLLAPACASFHINTPNGFAELEDDERYDYRAINADGVVIGVRAVRNEPQANLEFWGRVVDERLRRQGYVPAGNPEPVQSANGLAGVLFHYAATVGGREHRYQVAVFVRPKKVYVLEAGGDREVFDPAAAAVARAFRSFRT